MRLKQEGSQSEASLNPIPRLRLKQNKKNKQDFLMFMCVRALEHTNTGAGEGPAPIVTW